MDSASSLYPSCYTWTMSSSGTSDAYTFFECSPDAGSGVLLNYDPSSYTPSATVTDPTGTATETGSETQPPTNTGSPSPTGGGGGSSDTNVGAIAGGTVGGIAALGLVGLAAFLLLRHRRKSKASPSGSPPVQTVTAHPPPKTQSPSTPGTMYPSGPPSGFQGYPQYDPSMSQGYPQQQYGYAPQAQPQQYGALQPGQQNVYGGVAYQPGSAPAGSPPPHTTPSPGVVSSQGHTSPGGPQSPVSELQSINPVGMETNRAEMG